MKKSLWLPVISLAILLSVPLAGEKAHAQELKIGFVDYYSVLEVMPEMRAVERRLENFYRDKLSELEVKEREIQMVFEDFQTKMEVLSASARQREEQQLNDLWLELRRFQNEAQQQLQQRRMQLMTPLFEQLQTTINTVARQRDIDFVLQTTTANGDAIILWVDPAVRQQYDLTDAVKQYMDII